MKRTKKVIMALSVFMLMLGASIVGVSAATQPIGEDITVSGFPLGWVLVVVAIVLAVLLGLFLDTKYRLKIGIVATLVILGGLGLALIEVPIEVAEIEEAKITGWEVTGTNIAAAGWIKISATWDDTDEPTIITAPLNHDIGGAGMNTFDELTFVVNLTLDPAAGVGAKTDELVTMYYKSEYAMQYGGEDVLEKSGGNYLANWTNTDKVSSYYDGHIDMTIDETAKIQAGFEIDGDGNNTVGEHLNTVGESLSWTITLWDDYGWIDTYTVMLVVITTD